MSQSSSDSLQTLIHENRSRPFRKAFFLILLVAALSYAGYFGYQKWLVSRDQKTEYVTQTVGTDDINLVVSAAGSLAPTNQVVIGSELSGTTQAVYVDTNDKVTKGQALAKLDTTKITQLAERSKANVLAAKARVGQVKATVQETSAIYQRQKQLFDLSHGQTPSQATLDTALATMNRATADLAAAEAAVVGAEADVRNLERDLELSVLRSPVNGVVLARSLEVGQTVAASFTAPTLFTIAEDLAKMELVVPVAEADIGKVKQGQQATFTVDAWPGRTYQAKVTKVAYGSTDTGTSTSNSSSSNKPTTASGIVTYSTELEVANPDLSLLPGMTASVDIGIVDKKAIMVVPNAALRFDPEYAESLNPAKDSKGTIVQSMSMPPPRRWRGSSPPKTSKSDKPHKGAQVWILRNDQPVEVSVTTGITNGRVTEITGGDLKLGDPVILSLKPKPQS